MADATMAIIGVCAAAVALTVIDLSTVLDKVNRRFNEPKTVRGLLGRVGRLASTLPTALGFVVGHWLFSSRSMFAGGDPLYFFVMVGVMVAIGLVHGLAARRIMFPSWFAVVYIFLGLLLGSSITQRGGLP